MTYLTEEFKNQIKPFFFSEYNGSYSALLDAGTFKNEVFEKYYDKGIEGGGYNWDALAALYIEENLPHYKEELDHDSEAGMFCIYSKNELAIHDFLMGFKNYCEDDEKFLDLMERADFDEWD